jgi:hypothetical protein
MKQTLLEKNVFKTVWGAAPPQGPPKNSNFGNFLFFEFRCLKLLYNRYNWEKMYSKQFGGVHPPLDTPKNVNFGNFFYFLVRMFGIFVEQT